MHNFYSANFHREFNLASTYWRICRVGVDVDAAESLRQGIPIISQLCKVNLSSPSCMCDDGP